MANPNQPTPENPEAQEAPESPEAAEATEAFEAEDQSDTEGLDPQVDPDVDGDGEVPTWSVSLLSARRTSSASAQSTPTTVVARTVSALRPLIWRRSRSSHSCSRFSTTWSSPANTATCKKVL